MNLRQHREWQGQWHQLDGQEYYFNTGSDTLGSAKAHLPGFWTGSEGLAHPIRDRSGTRYVLKSFTIECPEREQRMRWLCGQGLSQCCSVGLLRGAPHKFLAAPILGQICPFVEGRTWDSWKTQWRTKSDEPNVPLTPDQRLWLAVSLAEAVRLLEHGLDLKHSDLSPGNIIIDYRNRQHLPGLSLIDFDAFYHRSVPILPVGRGQTLGTPGYQAPEFAGRNQIIRTDRCALAVLMHEFLAYGEDADLGEPDYRFFDQEDLDRGDARPADRFGTYWGESLATLFHRAWSARSTAERPSPDEWCDGLMRLGAEPPPTARLLLTAEHQGQRRRFDLQSPTIDLTRVLDPRIAVVLRRNSFRYEASCPDSQQCLAVFHDARTGKSMTLNHQAHAVQPGDWIVVGGWELRFDAFEEPAESKKPK